MSGFITGDSCGQAAIEYMTIFGIALLLSTPFIIKAQSSIVELKTGSSSLAVQNSLNDIETAVEMVDATGNQSVISLTVRIPRNLNSTEVREKSVFITLNTAGGSSDYFRTFDTNLTGTLPSNSGRHKIQANSLGDEVKIEVVS